MCHDRHLLYFHITLSCIKRIKRAVICIKVERGKKISVIEVGCAFSSRLFPLPHRPGLCVSLGKGLFSARMRKHLTHCLFQSINHLKLVGMRKDR